jgi:predicted transcriptional regulator YdeE
MIGDWMMENGIKIEERPMSEIYLNRDPRRAESENLKTEIYLPID